MSQIMTKKSQEKVVSDCKDESPHSKFSKFYGVGLDDA